MASYFKFSLFLRFFSSLLFHSSLTQLFFPKILNKIDLEGTTFDEIGLRFTSVVNVPSISSYNGDSSDEEEEDGEEERGNGGGGGRFGDNSRRRGFPSALAAAEAADAANLDAWRSVFRQHHYWKADLGLAVLLGMSTTRFRSNSNSVHEGNREKEKFFLLFFFDLAHISSSPFLSLSGSLSLSFFLSLSRCVLFYLSLCPSLSQINSKKTEKQSTSTDLSSAGSSPKSRKQKNKEGQS